MKLRVWIIVNQIIMISFVCLTIISQKANASVCHGKFADPINEVCWSCIFPISIGSTTVFNGSKPDTENRASALCMCPSAVGYRVGISIGYWEPIALVDVTTHPYCLVNLGGLQLSGDFTSTGEVDYQSARHNSSFYYVHWYKFPLMYWLNLFTDAMCFEKSDFDLAYLTELDPTWRDDELNFLLNPESVLFGNLVAQLACGADSAAALVHIPIDELFWCAGSQGSMYPLNGYVQEHLGGVQASTLLTERMTYKLHRMGMLWDSVGEESPLLCYTYPSPIIPKSRYRYQMTNPVPTVSGKGEDSCHQFGHTTAIWGAMHEFPYKGEDFGYLVWRKRNCCAL